jgi:hypothetical protein
MQKAVLILQCADRADRQCALDQIDRVIRDPALANLSFFDQSL